MKSMTGYGTVIAHNKDVELEISIKTVNGRYFDLRHHIPKEYAALESEFKKVIGAQVRRGTVDLYINRRHLSAASQSQVIIDTPLAKKWLKAYRDLGKSLKLDDDSTLQLVAAQPNVMLTEVQEKVTTGEKKLVSETLLKALTSCQKERVREGKSLKADLLVKIGELQSLAKTFSHFKKRANEELSKKVTSRLEKIDPSVDMDPQRIAQEVVIQIDKGDINEELVRLGEHLRAMKALINGKDSQGKKLDFYCQELLREVNTIGSKSMIAGLTESVVDAKAIVERIREQVQNVE